jgi:hypothetical protein|tara:strand:- start:290 stop:466 length:177 start_codon:yes stop_codon:yes gene_type:complete
MNEMKEEQLIEMFDTISEHEEQGCNPEEVASFVDLTVEEVELVKELAYGNIAVSWAMM